MYDNGEVVEYGCDGLGRQFGAIVRKVALIILAELFLLCRRSKFASQMREIVPKLADVIHAFGINLDVEIV